MSSFQAFKIIFFECYFLNEINVYKLLQCAISMTENVVLFFINKYSDIAYLFYVEFITKIKENAHLLREQVFANCI